MVRETLRLRERLQGVIKGKTLIEEPMRHHTYFRIGGPAEIMVFPTDIEDLKAVLEVARDESAAILVVGGGSNMLVLDSGFQGVVINLSRTFLGLSSNGGLIRCGAGVRTSRVLALSAMRGLTGFEGLTGVPGTVGGAIRGNAGTPSGTILDHLEWVRLIGEAGDERLLSRGDIRSTYRDSALPTGAVIVEAEFGLQEGVPAEIRRRISSLLVRRNLTQPVEFRSAGCIFKNPPGDFAGRLVESAGLKGLHRGGARISDKHANFIVNLGAATAADILWLIDRARTEVKARTGVALELEIQVVGSPVAH
jgi:UDP-N-acetylmuramate dehydrogenase